MFDSENLSSFVRLDMKMKRKTYEGLFKARVVSEWINGKRNLNELAERYSIHPNQIKNWKSLLLKGASQVLDDKRRSKSH
jgi:transposase-like protein